MTYNRQMRQEWEEEERDRGRRGWDEVWIDIHTHMHMRIEMGRGGEEEEEKVECLDGLEQQLMYIMGQRWEGKGENDVKRMGMRRGGG